MFVARHAKPANADIPYSVRPGSVRSSDVGDDVRDHKSVVSPLVREYLADERLNPGVAEKMVQTQAQRDRTVCRFPYCIRRGPLLRTHCLTEMFGIQHSSSTRIVSKCTVAEMPNRVPFHKGSNTDPLVALKLGSYDALTGSRPRVANHDSNTDLRNWGRTH